MALVTAEELADLRAEQASYFPDTCVISTPGGVTTGAGGVTNPTTSTATAVCRIAPAGRSGMVGDETQFADRLASRSLLTITMPYGTAVATTSTIYSPDVSGRAFEVISIAPPAGLELARQVAVAEKNR